MLTSDDIWAELRRRRITASWIAGELRVAVSTVTRTINGAHRSPRVLARIADLLDVPVDGLAPELHVSHFTRKPGYRSTSDDPEITNPKRPLTGPAEPPLAAAGGLR